MAKTIESVERCLTLLELISEREVVKLADLPDALGVSRATAFRMLITLQERGYVERVENSQGYRLGPGVAVLAKATESSLLMRLTREAMTDLRERTGETINFGLPRGRSLVYAEVIEGAFALRLSGSVGQLIPPHATSLGKAFLAACSDDRQRQLVGGAPFRAYTDRTIVDWEMLTVELEEIRQRGYATEVEEMDVGASCVGAAIRDARGEPVAAISVSGFVARVGAQEREHYGVAVAGWCDRISRELGFQPG